MKTKTRIIIGATLVPKKSGFLSRLIVVVSLWFLAISTSAAQEFANIEYLCCDWGPAMTWSGKTNEPPKFGDTAEEIYFLKQVGRFTRNTRLMPDLFSGSKTEDIGKGVSIYLCKMKPDGSEKMEIRELWHNVTYPIDTQAQSTWMDVNDNTHKIALSITFAGSDLTGLWAVDLCGGDLKRIVTPSVVEGHVQAIDSPSWTPDGQWIVFGESLRGGNRGRIAKCDEDGANLVYLTDGPMDSQPRVSPGGKRVAFIRWIAKGKALDSWLWLVNLDGTENHPLPNPQAKPNWSAQAHWGTHPTWSPDGKKVLIIGSGIEIIDVTTGRRVLSHEPTLQGKRGTCGTPQWGKLGFVGMTSVGGILLTDSGLQEAKWIGSSKLVECTGSKGSCQW